MLCVSEQSRMRAFWTKETAMGPPFQPEDLKGEWLTNPQWELHVFEPRFRPLRGLALSPSFGAKRFGETRLVSSPKLADLYPDPCMLT